MTIIYHLQLQLLIAHNQNQLQLTITINCNLQLQFVIAYNYNNFLYNYITYILTTYNLLITYNLLVAHTQNQLQLKITIELSNLKLQSLATYNYN